MDKLELCVEDYLDEWYKPETGEEALFSAILDRAIRDLNYSTGSVLPNNIKSAIGWFEGYFDDHGDFIQFSQVCEVLELSDTIKNHIRKLIKRAEVYLDERRRHGIFGDRSWSEWSLGTDRSEWGSSERRTMGSARRFTRRPKSRINTLGMYRKSRRSA